MTEDLLDTSSQVLCIKEQIGYVDNNIAVITQVCGFHTSSIPIIARRTGNIVAIRKDSPEAQRIIITERVKQFGLYEDNNY
ncbi:hypothetical protein NQ317_002206 [Molorchus minor]|uniref:Uncharacterized protein n=1 Tax=Molorchus minor TaxID=1323400 RepID=A0ABQ9IZG3_9CUCU|nr:hypothetical protein NQ317_002206 [Molorchus minor]